MATLKKGNNTGEVNGPTKPAANKAEEANPIAKPDKPIEMDPLDALQLALDLVGMIPGAGAVADLLNAAISAYRGDFIGAAFNLFSAVPAIGDGAAAAKIIKNSDKYLQALKVIEAKVLPMLPNSLRKKMEDFLAQIRKKMDDLTKKDKPSPKKNEPETGAKVKNDCSQYAKGPPGATHKGGQHKEVVKDSKLGARESHHIPPKSISGTGAPDGPAISMDYADHRGLSSTGRNTTNPQSIAQGALAKSGPAGYLAAMMVEITEIREKHGSKYDLAIAWMLLWAACKGYIPSPTTGRKK